MTRGQGGGGRDELSRTLFALRRSAGLKQAEAGSRAGIGQRKISRFENGLYLPTIEEVDALLGVYRAPADTVTRLRQIVRDRRAQIPPARAVIRRGHLAAVQDQIRRIEDTAVHVRSYQPAVIIGLLQTPAYMTAVFGGESADAKAAVAARLGRQAALAQPDRQFTLIHTEGALRCLVGSPSLMADQLDHIATAATQWPDRVRIGIVAWSTPIPALVQHGFHVYDQTAAIVGTHTGTTILTDRHDIDDYEELFNKFAQVAAYETEAAEIATRIADDYRGLA